MLTANPPVPMHSSVYFPYDLPVSPALRVQWENAGYRLEPFHPEIAASTSIFLLATPLYVADVNAYVAPGGVWQRYLEKHNPSAKLIHTGLFPNDLDKNYLHWLRPLDNLEAFLLYARSADKGPLPPVGRSESLENIWSKFWDGHDKNGFSYYFIDLLTNIKICAGTLNKRSPNIEQEKRDLADLKTPELIASVLRSWTRYRPYWLTTPFSKSINRVDACLAPLEIDLFVLSDPEAFQAHVRTLVNELETAQGMLEYLRPYFVKGKENER